MKQSRLHLYLTLLWIGLGIPAVVWWHDSVFLVGLMTLYSIISNHWGAFQSAKAKEAIETKENDHDK